MKDVSIAQIAEKDNFLSFALFCSVDEEESEDSAGTLSNLLFGFINEFFQDSIKKTFGLASSLGNIRTGENRLPLRSIFQRGRNFTE